MANTSKEWLQAIAGKAGVKTSEVEAVLAAHRIQPTPVLGVPRRLYLREIEFSGVKSGIANGGPFCFSWKDLQHGLWAMLSEQNFRGKSTIIEVARWMLRGHESSTLQEDVRSWIHKARLRFVLDADTFEIDAKTHGHVIGTLSRVRSTSENCLEESTELAAFESSVQFESVMSNFFMQAFSMDAIATWRKNGSEDGTPVAHGWAALSGAMFIGTNYEVLLGDLPTQSGVPARLMQMYLGVPWVSTLAAARTALQVVEQAVKSSSRRNAQSQKKAKQRIESIESDLDIKRAELQAMPDDEAIRKAIRMKSGPERLVIEVKREEKDASFDALATSYAAQTTDYQNVSIRLGVLLVLDLATPSRQGTPHLTSLFSVTQIQRPNENEPRLVLVVKVPGRRRAPSDLTKLAKSTIGNRRAPRAK
ncbi:hypothetical protein [Burkholderia ubonensis]|uniref:hypothetical protein n=1 Tax=Burkholderia ubonensis TaxID=101571 RepID=UPI0009B40685|nr:hypothetical protein [Burkholderia ubonensis]